MKPIVLRERAADDVDEAVAHYLGEAGEALAIDFIDELERAFRKIGAHPQAGSTRYAIELDLPELRFWGVKRFPYLVFHVELDGEIDVWRVLQAQRDIPAWLMQGVDS